MSGVCQQGEKRTHDRMVSNNSDPSLGEKHVRKRSAGEGWLCGEGEAGERQGKCTDQRPTWRRNGFAEDGEGRKRAGRRAGGESQVRSRWQDVGRVVCRLSRPAIVTNPRKSHKVDSESTNRASVTLVTGSRVGHCHSVADAQASVPAALDVGEEGGREMRKSSAIKTLGNLSSPVAQPPTRPRSQIWISHLLDTPFPNQAPTVLPSALSLVHIPFHPSLSCLFFL